MKKTISFQLDTALLAQIDEVAKQGNGNRSEVLRRMIEKLLEDRPASSELPQHEGVASVASLPAFE